MSKLEELKKREESLREKEDAFLRRNKINEFFNGLWDFIIKIIPIIKEKLFKK